MEQSVFISIFLVAMIGVITPMITHLVPRNLVPESVALVVLGIVVGPHVLGWAALHDPIIILKELGIGFLFLLAGYEVNTNDLKGPRGIRAITAWTVSLALALVVVGLLGWAQPLSRAGMAYAVALTATALGTLLPILKERGLLSNNVGKAVLAHGTIGEMMPIIMMAFFLSGRGFGLSTVIVVFFIAVAAIIAAIPVQVRKFGHRITNAIHLGSHSTAQMTVRLVFMVLAGLMTLAVVLDLDLVLGAFAAGMIVRRAIPEGRAELEVKLDGIAYGIFIPLFFVISGMSIDIGQVSHQPWMVPVIVGLLMVIRGLPIFLIAVIHNTAGGSVTGTIARLGESTQIALYSTTSLPIIVAVTELAHSGGLMSAAMASSFVVAGVVSVLVMPALAVLIPLEYRKVAKEDAGTNDEWLPWIEHSWHSDQ